MELNLIKIIFKHTSGILYFLSALLGLMGIFVPRIDMYIKAKCMKYLNIIYKSNWIELPETIIKLFLQSIDKFNKRIEFLSFSFLQGDYSEFLFCVGFLFLILGFQYSYYSNQIEWIYIFVAIIISSFVLIVGFSNNKIFPPKHLELIENIAAYTFIILVLFMYSVMNLIWYSIFMKLNIYISFFVFAAIFFSFGVTILPLFSLIKIKYDKINVEFIYFIMFISSIVTLLSLIIGHRIMPDLWVPKTIRMIISNFIFDIFTVYTTIYLLKWAIKKHVIFRIPIAIAIDIILASLFACFSLYFGLIFSDKSLSIVETLNILIAKSPGGHTFEYGPYFWVMHTAFIPTFLYLLVLSFSWYVKLILIPIVRLFGVIQNKNSLQVFAFILAFIAAFFNLLYLYV